MKRTKAGLMLSGNTFMSIMTLKYPDPSKIPKTEKNIRKDSKNEINLRLSIINKLELLMKKFRLFNGFLKTLTNNGQNSEREQ